MNELPLSEQKRTCLVQAYVTPTEKEWLAAEAQREGRPFPGSKLGRIVRKAFEKAQKRRKAPQ